MIFSRFRWYRRMRGGYWAQVSGMFGKRWIKSKGEEPTPNHVWTFFPWASKEAGNGYIDEWYFDDCEAWPLSHKLRQLFGTSDPEKLKNMIIPTENETPASQFKQ